MSKAAECVLPIREVNKSSAEARRLRKALIDLLRTARFAGHSVASNEKRRMT